MNQEEDYSTAKAWIIFEKSRNKYCRGYNTMQKMEMASLTKMYTVYSCLSINQELNIRPEQYIVQVLQSTEVGTLAHLTVDKYIKLEDLYYGLMLPSGNDAALILAYYYGYWLGMSDKIPAYRSKKQQVFSLEGKKKYNKIYLSRFIHYMNHSLVKQKLKHIDTHFQNPHGLSDKLQKSTAWEIANAVLLFLKNPKFTEIVQTQSYQFEYYEDDDCAPIRWDNTNILLREPYSFIGIKTGHTVTAGNCLASRKLVRQNGKIYDLVLVVLGCEKLEQRFTQTVNLLQSFRSYLQTTNF